MAWNNDLGKWGEGVAAQYLTERGLTILERDWHDGHRDLDIVAIDIDKRLLVIVEVKTRSNENYGTPDEAVGFEKMNNIITATRAYQRLNRMWNYEVRYDVICILGTNTSNMKLTHKESAFDSSVSFVYYEKRRKSARFRRKY